MSFVGSRVNLRVLYGPSDSESARTTLPSCSPVMPATTNRVRGGLVRWSFRAASCNLLSIGGSSLPAKFGRDAESLLIPYQESLRR